MDKTIEIKDIIARKSHNEVPIIASSFSYNAHVM